MKEIHVNLKRFDVPRSFGGLCIEQDSSKWIKNAVEELIDLGLGEIDGLRVCLYLPESLIGPAADVIKAAGKNRKLNLFIGSQGVFREDVRPGENFGAFTTNLPPAAAVNLGASWTIIGHSEERRDKEEMLALFAEKMGSGDHIKSGIRDTVNLLLNREVHSGMQAGLDILYCVGETAEDKGPGDFESQKGNIEAVLKNQLISGLSGIGEYPDRLTLIGYEPRWAIGPGKTPPGENYISFVSSLIKKICIDEFGREFPVIYGGGLKEANAAMIAGIPSIDGGLVALTRFTGEIGFYPEDFKIIVDKYFQ